MTSAKTRVNATNHTLDWCVRVCDSEKDLLTPAAAVSQAVEPFQGSPLCLRPLEMQLDKHLHSQRRITQKRSKQIDLFFSLTCDRRAALQPANQCHPLGWTRVSPIAALTGPECGLHWKHYSERLPVNSLGLSGRQACVFVCVCSAATTDED